MHFVYFLEVEIHVVEDAFCGHAEAGEWRFHVDDLATLAHKEFPKDKELLTVELDISENDWVRCIS